MVVSERSGGAAAGTAGTGSPGDSRLVPSSSWHAADIDDLAAAADVGRHPHEEQQQQAPAYKDDAPMTPVVYLVLWTSVAVGALNGYASQGTLVARQTESYIKTFSNSMPGQLLFATKPSNSPFCSTGVDGLPGVSWYESVISVVPPTIAPILAALFIRHRGRTRGIMLGCVMMVAGLVLMSSASHVVQLYLSYAVVHAAHDVLYLGVLVQMVEVAPRTSRGRFLLIHILGGSLGSCLVAVTGYAIATSSTLGWRLLLGMGVVPALAVLLVMPWMVDTPQSFIERGKYAQGWAALRDIRGPFYKDTYGEYMSIVAAAAVAPKGLRMYLELFSRRRYVPALCVGVVMALLSAQLDPHSRSYVAYNTLVHYGTRSRDAALMTTLTQTLAYAAGTVVCAFLVDRMGRLPLLRLSTLLAIATSLVLVVAGIVYSADYGVNLQGTLDVGPRNWPYLQLAALCVLSGANGLAWASAMWVIIAEAQALTVRPAAVAVCLATANLSMMVIEIHLLCVMRVFYYVFVLGVSFVALAVACFFVPETARVPLEAITALYGRHWLWRHVMHPRPRHPRGSAGTRGRCGGSSGGRTAAAAAGAATGPAVAQGPGAGEDVLQEHLPTLPQLPRRLSTGSTAATAAAAAAAVTAAAAAADVEQQQPSYDPRRHVSPFGHKDIQLAELLQPGGGGGGDHGGGGGGSSSNGRDSGGAAAAAAIAAATASAAAVALLERSGGGGGGSAREGGGGGGAAGAGSLTGAASSGGLGSAWLHHLHGRGSRGSRGWLSSRLRSSLLPQHVEDGGGEGEGEGHDVVDRLAEELQQEGG